MSPLSGFLAVIVFFTAILVAYLTKQFQNENLNYSSSNQMKNTNTKVKTIEKEKVVAIQYFYKSKKWKIQKQLIGKTPRELMEEWQ